MSQQVAGGIELSRESTGFLESIEAELAPLGERMTNHPIILDIENGTASTKLVRNFSREFLPIVRGTYRRMSMRLQHAASHDLELQSALLKEVCEEIWHIPMYLKFCATVGLKIPDDFLQMYLPETYAFILFVDATSTGRATLEESCVRVFESEAWDGFNNYSQQSSLVQTMAASSLALKGFPLACDRLAEGFQSHYGCTKDDVEFWYEHGTVDMEHALAGGEIVDRYATTPELRNRAREAALLSIQLWIKQWDAIYETFRE